MAIKATPGLTGLSLGEPESLKGAEEDIVSKKSFQFARLYHRLSDTSAGEMVAASAGLTQVHWDEFRRLAALMPPPPDQRPQGALGVFRGQTVDFILAHAHVDADGQPGVQYVQLSADALRKIAGRVTLLHQITGDGVPPINGKILLPVQMEAPVAPTMDEQVDDLLALTLMLEDNFSVIEGLLSALIQGVPVGIINGPSQLDQQLAFIQGVLTLLPVPARFGVTFTTYTRKLDPSHVQLAFLAHDALPAEALGFDWASGALIGAPPEDPYARFIMQQFRLDVSLAVQHMVSLTRTAGWRLTRQESLAEALGWAAKRVALDSAVTEGQPADMAQVALVLREDPTLTDELRVRYVRHLLALTLALGNPATADVIASQVVVHPRVADAVLETLEGTAASRNPWLVYQLVARWMAMPDGPAGSLWRQRAYTAAVSHLQALVAARDVPATIACLQQMQTQHATRIFEYAAGDLFEVVMPLAASSHSLTECLLLLAAEHLPASAFQRLARTQSFNRLLPTPFRTVVGCLPPAQETAVQPGMLAGAAASFGADNELIILARLVEWCLAAERPDLIDTPVLIKLVVLVRSPLKARYETLLRLVVQDLGRSSLLILLEPPGPRLLVEIALLLGDYKQVVKLLERISATLFRGDNQVKFAPWVSELFEHVSLSTSEALAAGEQIAALNLKPVPKGMAYRGMLINKTFDSTMAPLFDYLSDLVCAEPYLVSLVGYHVCLRVLQYYAKQRDVDHAVALAAVLTNSLEGSAEGFSVMGRIWSLLNWSKDVRQVALELMRRYVRQLPHEQAVQAPARVGRKLGARIGDMLRATVTLRLMTGGRGFDTYIQDVHTTTALLRDLVQPYEYKPLPPLLRLRSDLDAMTGGLSDTERVQIGDDFLALASLSYQLGAQRGDKRNRDRVEQKLLVGRAEPKVGTDALLWIGGYFAEGKSLPLDLEQTQVRHILGSRSMVMLKDDVATTRRVLADLLTAFAPDTLPRLTVPAFRAEIDSLWKGLNPYDQVRLREDFSQDMQALAALLIILYEKGDGKALEDSNLGRQIESARREPKSAIEVMRLLSGYFQRKFRL